MPKMKPSEPTGWENNPSRRPYGLPFFLGKKVSVTFGRLGSSYWYEHSFDQVRLVLTFKDTLGMIEITRPGMARYPDFFLRPHQLCIIPPKLLTTLDWVHRSELVVLYVDVPGYVMGEPFPSDIIFKDFRAIARRDACLSQVAQMFLLLCRQSEPPEPEFVEGLGIELASRALKEYSPDESGPKARSGFSIDTVNQLSKYIDAHLGEAILTKDLARQVGLSPDHFARRFKIATGMGSMPFVLKRRMERVHELLGTGKFNVTEAGREAGFHDLSHLNRCFRKVFGCSPKAVLKTALASDLSQ